MNKAKELSTPLGYFKLSITQCPATEEDKAETKKVTYASGVGNLMYAWFALGQI